MAEIIRLQPLHRGKPFVIYESPARAPAPISPRSEPVNLYESFQHRRSLFIRVCDCLADFIADVATMPGTAFALILFGQFTVVLAAAVWSAF